MIVFVVSAVMCLVGIGCFKAVLLLLPVWVLVCVECVLGLGGLLLVVECVFYVVG